MVRPILYLTCIFFLTVGCAEGEHAAMIDALEIKAAQGDLASQFQLATEYDQGLKVPQDIDKAVKWYRAAAEQGDANAQYSMGSLYQAGDGVPQNNQLAITWYRKAAEQDHATAKNNLAYMYDFGLGIAEDNAQAAQLYEEASQLGEIRAMLNLGVLFWQGQSGVNQDYVEAYQWLDLARLYAHESSDMRLERSAQGALDKLSPKMTALQIEEALKRTQAWDQANRSTPKSE